jgi:hypothetical protein
MQPGIPWADQPAAIVDRSEALEIRFDAVSHIIIEAPLLGSQIGRWNERQSHAVALSFLAD